MVYGINFFTAFAIEAATMIINILMASLVRNETILRAIKTEAKEAKNELFKPDGTGQRVASRNELKGNLRIQRCWSGRCHNTRGKRRAAWIPSAFGN